MQTLKKTLLVLTTVILLMLNSCNDNLVSPFKKDYPFAIYFLKDTYLPFGDAVNKNITLNDLADTPWLTQDDIEFYDWSSHCIYLKKNKEYLFPAAFTLDYGMSVWWNKVLVVVVNGEICYKISGRHGVQPLPEITYVQILIQYPDDILNIEWPYPFAHDERNNEKVKKSLTAAGLIHEGLQVTLDTVSVIENSNVATIEYTFTLTNKDKVNLYVFDPDKVENNIFHYYTNGPVLLNAETGKLYLSTFKKATPTDNWSQNWFTRVGISKSIKRTVRLKGYPHFDPSEYAIIFEYSCPNQIYSKDRIATDGRYWIGESFSNYSFKYIE